jgi:type IV pilus assembly protein PilB
MTGVGPQGRFRKKAFGDLAVGMGFMTQEQLDFVISKKNISNQMIGQLCIDEGCLDDEELARIIAAQYSYDYVELDRIESPELLSLVDIGYMTRHKFIPYRKKGGLLEIAMAEPLEFFKVVDELATLLDMEISLVVVSKTKLNEFLKKLDTSKSALESVSDDMRMAIVRESEKGVEELSLEKISADESVIVKIVDSTLLDAITKQASDIHIETSDVGIVIRYRIDGMLHQATEPLDPERMSAIVSRIKVMSELDISEKRVPQDGRFKLKVRERYIDFRVSILPTIYGENVVIRILDRDKMSSREGGFTLDALNLPVEELARLRRMIHAPYGMFLMTGPTGSGKTSTLYRALSEVNHSDSKIITIEDPVEYQLKGITQIPVNEKKGLTFARGLRSILRHDPDKILVGEIRDSETAQIALQSALTGHLVFTTVHANSSFEVMNRFVHMGIEPYNLMAALNCIVAQRLIRVLCDCKGVMTVSKTELKESGLAPERFSEYAFYRAKGCDRCKGTGYRGRKAIIELLELDDEMRELFIRKAPASELKKKALESGTLFLRSAALREVLNGETTLSEANRVTFVESDHRKIRF